MKQIEFNISNDKKKFPNTRYQGSKYKIADWIWENIKDLEFNSAIDLFGGTGVISYELKKHNKKVIYNDILKFNSIIGTALIENNNVKLLDEDINYILTKHNDVIYKTTIQDNFKDIFYLDEENKWLDMVCANINNIENKYKKSIAYFALFQACLSKRPYNLFHRANLYMRTQEVKRSFGNKNTWDKPFEEHFKKFVEEANNCLIDINGCKSINCDALEIDINKYKFDMVYIDTPYINMRGVGTDYLDFYHFLEGIVNYDEWDKLILHKYKHKPIKGKGENKWTKKKFILDEFNKLFEKYKDKILVISYRGDGIPNEEEIKYLLLKYKKNIREIKAKDYKYALSKTESKELLFIAY